MCLFSQQSGGKLSNPSHIKWNDHYHKSSLLFFLSAAAVHACDRWGQQRRMCRQIQATDRKKEKENAIKDKTLNKQASAKIQEGEKHERRKRRGRTKKRVNNKAGKTEKHEKAEKTANGNKRLTMRWSTRAAEPFTDKKKKTSILIFCRH